MTLPTWNPKTKPECDPGYALLSDHADRDIDAMEHNYAYIGGNTYTPAEDHAHDGTSSAPVDAADLSGSLTEGQIGSASVDQTALKTTTEAQSTSSIAVGGRFSFTFSSAGSHGFWPQVASTHTAEISYYLGHNPGSSYITQVGFELYGSGSGYIYAQIRYVQSSPPHEFLVPGEDHGGWLYLVLDQTEAIRWSWFALDPPWWLRGFRELGKVGKIAPWRFMQRPHPFKEAVPYGLPEGWRVVLVDLRHLNEQVEVRPAKAALEEHERRLPENLSKGIGQDQLRLWGRRLQAAASSEENRVSEAKLLLGGLDELRSRRYLEIARDTRKSEDAKGVLREVIDSRLAAARQRLLLQTGVIRKIDQLMRPDGSGAGEILKMVNDGTLPGLSSCVKVISDDTSHPLFRRLPDPPGLFRRGQDGSAPVVQVVTQ